MEKFKRDLIDHLSGFVTENRLALFKKVLGERTRYITVLLEDIYQSQNASAVLRTCDCTGIQDVHIVEQENPEGIIVQFGGQTPLNLSVPLSDAGVNILGTSPDSIDRAEDRERFQVMLKKLGILQPENGIAVNKAQAIRIADRIGYPVVVRPSFVLGGRAMEIVYDRKDLEYYMETAVQVSPGKPVLIDRFLDGAIEIDVDAISDGHDTIIGGIMEHIEEAGIHSGDSACVLPPVSLAPEVLKTIMEHTRALAKELSVVGLMNIQYGVKDGIIYVIEVNPRASRTVPFVSKATGVPLANMATQVIMGKTLKELEAFFGG